MAKASNIEWTDSTVNFWWGCTKVGPGCDHCYAETWSKRTGGNIWGTGVARRKIKSAVALLHRLNGDTVWPIMANRSRRVFIQSMSDLFDLEVPVEWFAEAWQTIERCGQLNIQIVTKRISAVEKRLAAIGVTTWPKHAGLMITVCNQAEADRDIPRLLELKMKLGIPWVGLSMEPLLGPAHILKYLYPLCDRCSPWETPCRTGCENCTSVDWVIVGGESGSGARPIHPDWVRTIRDECKEAGVAFFFKQWGDWHPCEVIEGVGYPMQGHKPFDSWEAPVFDPEITSGWNWRRLGKKAAGRTLDGTTHNEFPEVT